jgi:hypothetical protein
MSNTNTGGPAFPYENRYEHEGMTLRDYFAAKAMQTLASYEEFEPEQAAEKAYQYADAMLKAREA